MDEQLNRLIRLRAALVNSFLHHYLPSVDWAIEEIRNLHAVIDSRDKALGFESLPVSASTEQT